MDEQERDKNKLRVLLEFAKAFGVFSECGAEGEYEDDDGDIWYHKTLELYTKIKDAGWLK